jgi:hypothetical protein
MESLGKRDTPQARSVFRYRSATGWLSAGLALAFVMAVAAVASPKGNLAIGVCCCLMVVVSVRLWMTGVYLRGNGIRVVNPYSSKTVPWDEVDSFAVAPFGQYRYGAYMVRSRIGGRIPIFALASKRMGPGRDPQKSVDELNEALRLRRTDPHSLQGLVDSLG